jgi:hypothetical protein
LPPAPSSPNPPAPSSPALNNWDTNAATVDVPDVATNFTGTIPGRVSGGEGTIEFYDDDASTAVRTALAEGTVGFIMIAKAGKVTGRRCEVWPVTVASITDSQVDTGTNPSTFTVAFALTAKPSKTAVCP